jgi:hypothetical protein
MGLDGETVAVAHVAATAGLHGVVVGSNKPISAAYATLGPPHDA